MAIDFPDSPSLNDTFTAGGKVYQWDGTAWEIYGPNVSPGTFKIDDVNNRVGINKTSPTTALDVVGDMRVYDASTGGNASAGQFHASGTGANILPSGTTAERPANPAEGATRYNSTLQQIEAYLGGEWQAVKQAFVATGGTKTTSGAYTVHTFTSSGTFQVTSGTKEVEYVVVAGGGGTDDGAGSIGGSGGGGAGGYRSSVVGESSGGGASAESKLTVTAQNYTVTVGAGGTGFAQGNDSVFGSITSIGGGAGHQDSTASTYNGGSGGGQGVTSNAPSGAVGSGTAGQGYDGGSASTANSGTTGGGGGAGQAGSAGNGGNGVQSSIDGTATYRAGGGAGEAVNGTTFTGGLGGGGDSATNGTANTGGGAGGHSPNDSPGYNGGSGIVIIRYLT